MRACRIGGRAEAAFAEKNLMPLTTLDPKTALIVVDLQKGIINSPFMHPIDAVIERTRACWMPFVGVIFPSSWSMSLEAHQDGRSSRAVILRSRKDLLI